MADLGGGREKERRMVGGGAESMARSCTCCYRVTMSGGKMAVEGELSRWCVCSWGEAKLVEAPR